MHLGADPVAHILLHDSQLVTGFLGGVENYRLDGVTDQVDTRILPAASPCLSQGGNGGPQRPLSGAVQVLVRFASVVADDGGKGRVPMPLHAVGLHIGTTVAAKQVTVLQHPLAGDAMHNLLVNRGAHRGRVAVVAQEVGLSFALFDSAGADLV